MPSTSPAPAAVVSPEAPDVEELGTARRGSAVSTERDIPSSSTFGAAGAGLRGILDAFVAIDGVQWAVLADREGFLLESTAEAGVDAEAAGALAACLAESSDGLGRELGRGPLNGLILEYDKGLVVLVSVGSAAILAVGFSEPSALGKNGFSRNFRAGQGALCGETVTAAATYGRTRQRRRLNLVFRPQEGGPCFHPRLVARQTAAKSMIYRLSRPASWYFGSFSTMKPARVAKGCGLRRPGGKVPNLKIRPHDRRAEHGLTHRVKASLELGGPARGMNLKLQSIRRAPVRAYRDGRATIRTSGDLGTDLNFGEGKGSTSSRVLRLPGHGRNFRKMMRYRDLCALGSISTDRGLPPPGGTEYASIFRIVARLPRYGTPRGTGKADVPKTDYIPAKVD
jgi:predicted regulator of Ras-like GTPase activity (Roadblock/LC7/MglB family)